ncbi:TolC family protein [Lacrimispora amygdalina]|uniref:TolC family protein n=1 Tax=Lacrimispora amygdalina TaxID=253257 RepID=UPI000BE2D3B8|nr:TolC family protein [Lacrimispora amygdalina]
MRKKWISPVLLAAILSINVAFPALAAGPGQTEDPIPEGVTQEQWNRLNDQRIEFDELGDLVRYFNPTMKNAETSFSTFIGDYQYIVDKMRRQVIDLQSDADELKESGAVKTVEGATQYSALNYAIKSYKKSADNTQKMLDKMSRENSSGRADINKGSKTLTYYADQTMIGYNSAQASRSMIEKLVELSNAAYEAQKLSAGLGLATEADILSAQKDLLSAQGSLLKINSTIDNLSSSLCLMTGYSANATPAIGGLPQLTDEMISSLNLEEDTQKAVSNNYDVISERHISSGKTTTGMKNKDDYVSEAEQNIIVTMQALYQEILQSKTAYEAANTAFQKATLEKEKADRSYNLKMLSKIQYLQAQMAYLKAQGEKESAYNTFYQAYNTYQWAVDGIILNSAK